MRQDWTDPDRSRTIPVRIRLPRTDAPAPMVLISHGLGGSREGLGYLGAALAESGFAAIHLQHHGSDIAIWQGVADTRAAFSRAITDPRNALDRLRDVTFALDELARRNEADPALRGRLDLGRAAIAGHSFGAWTVSHVLGQRLPLGSWSLRFPDTRLKAGIALSPLPPLGISPLIAYAPIKAPILHITGTRDTGIEGTTPEDRTIPFRNTAAPSVLVVLSGATHASFAAEEAAGSYWSDPTYHARIAELSVLFLRAVLEEDEAARETLRRGAPLRPGDTIEAKGF